MSDSILLENEWVVNALSFLEERYPLINRARADVIEYATALAQWGHVQRNDDGTHKVRSFLADTHYHVVNHKCDCLIRPICAHRLAVCIAEVGSRLRAEASLNTAEHAEALAEVAQ